MKWKSLKTKVNREKDEEEEETSNAVRNATLIIRRGRSQNVYWSEGSLAVPVRPSGKGNLAARYLGKWSR